MAISVGNDKQQGEPTAEFGFDREIKRDLRAVAFLQIIKEAPGCTDSFIDSAFRDKTLSKLRSGIFTETRLVLEGFVKVTELPASPLRSAAGDRTPQKTYTLTDRGETLVAQLRATPFNDEYVYSLGCIRTDVEDALSLLRAQHN